MSLKKNKTKASNRIILCDSLHFSGQVGGEQKKEKEGNTWWQPRDWMPMSRVFKSFHFLLTFSLTVFEQGRAVDAQSLFAVAQQNLWDKAVQSLTDITLSPRHQQGVSRQPEGKGQALVPSAPPRTFRSAARICSQSGQPSIRKGAEEQRCSGSQSLWGLGLRYNARSPSQTPQRWLRQREVTHAAPHALEGGRGLSRFLSGFALEASSCAAPRAPRELFIVTAAAVTTRHQGLWLRNLEISEARSRTSLLGEGKET